MVGMFEWLCVHVCVCVVRTCDCVGDWRVCLFILYIHMVVLGTDVCVCVCLFVLYIHVAVLGTGVCVCLCCTHM